MQTVADATTPLDVGEQLVSVGDVSRERLGAPLGRQIKAHRKNFGKAVEAALARQRDVALDVEATGRGGCYV